MAPWAKVRFVITPDDIPIYRFIVPYIHSMLQGEIYRVALRL